MYVVCSPLVIIGLSRIMTDSFRNFSKILIDLSKLRSFINFDATLIDTSSNLYMSYIHVLYMYSTCVSNQANLLWRWSLDKYTSVVVVTGQKQSEK